MGSRDRGHIVKIVGGVQDLSDLLLQGVFIVFVAVAQRENADAGHEIKVFLSLDIVEIHAFAVIEDNLVAVISVQQVCLGLIDHHFHCHFAHYRYLPAVMTAFICPLFSGLLRLAKRAVRIR